MDEVNSLADQFQDAANEFWTTVGDYLPKLLGAFLLVVVALIVAKLAQALVERVLKLVRVDRLVSNKQVAKTLKTAEVDVDVVSAGGRIVFWIVMIIFALTIADVLDLSAMSDVLHDILN